MIPYISIVVPIFEQWNVISHLIKALGDQTLPSEQWELLIVDNGSTDIPENFRLPDFARLIYCEQPGSYAARNKGLECVSGSVIVFTDADCVPEPNWLEEILSCSELSGMNTLVAGNIKVRGKDGYPFCSDAEAYDVMMGLPQKAYVSRGYAVTANLLVPRAIFDSLGAFDSKRFSGGDAEFCRRSIKNGFRLVYADKAVVYHPARTEMSELIIKRKRVKGGQVKAGEKKRRLMYVFRTFLPPVREINKAVLCKGVNSSCKLAVVKVSCFLWGVEMLEVIRLLLGKSPERR